MNWLIFFDVIAAFVFAFQILLVVAGLYEVHTEGKTDTYPSTFFFLISLGYLTMRIFS